jgi:hypothetical protein
MRHLLAAMACALLASGSTWAASFDCAKARRPLEKFICSNPELDALDTRMGEVFRQVNAGFPLKGFLLTTQRVFLAGYPSCMSDASGKPAPAAQAVRSCANALRERSAELQAQALALVYSNAKDRFTHDDLAILVYTVEGRTRIRLWGNWMPDAYNPQPFPQGVWCDIDEELKPTQGGYKTDMTDDTVFAVAEKAVKISEHIMCSPRTGISPGAYRRIR